jgi:vomeronasal 2 receptor
LISSLYFAIEEINRNIHILPNISLLVKIECNLIVDNEERVWSMKRKEIIPNFYCKNQRRYLIVLTGPLWITSYRLGPLLYFSRTPEVSQGGLHLLKYLVS